MPLPRIPLPEPPTNLQELLDQACNTDEKPFFRLNALATLLVRLDRWFEEMADFCNERGGTFGMDAATLRKLAVEKEQHEPGSVHVLEIDRHSDSEPTFRDATPDEAWDASDQLGKQPPQ
jgi:hypothetical protein